MAVNDVSSSAKTKANEWFNYGQRQVDRVISPPTRQRAYDWVYDLSRERPVLFSFIAFQFIFSLAPLLLFAGFATTTIAVSFISALLFSLFWIGIATLFLVPTLFLTITIALLFWAWVAAGFFAGRYVYNRLPFSASGDGKVVANGGGKKIIFEKKDGKNNNTNADTDFDIKAEATEVKE